MTHQRQATHASNLTHQKTSQAWLKLDPPKTGQATHQEQAKRGSNLTHQKQAKRGFKLDQPKTSQEWLKLDSPKTSQATHQHHTKNKPSSLPDGGRHREPWGALEFALVSLVLIFIHCARGAQDKQRADWAEEERVGTGKGTGTGKGKE